MNPPLVWMRSSYTLAFTFASPGFCRGNCHAFSASNSQVIMGRAVGDGLRTYYKGKIEELELLIKDKGHNLRRLEAQRNELNASGSL